MVMMGSQYEYSIDGMNSN